MTSDLSFWFINRTEKNLLEKQAVSISTINKAGEWRVKPQASRAGFYLHLSLGRLGRTSDHYVSLIFPTSKSTQPSHAPHPHPPAAFTVPVYTKAQIKKKKALHYSIFPSKYFGTCSYLQGTHGTCRIALPMTAHSLCPWNFLLVLILFSRYRCGD